MTARGLWLQQHLRRESDSPERRAFFKTNMKDYKVKIVMNKITLTSETDPNSKMTFDDLNRLVAKVNKDGINITNKEVLPPAFQIQITTNK